MKRKKTIGFYVNYLPVYGCLSTGLIYCGIGIIAILSFMKIKDGGADESSLLAYLNESFIGKIIFWLIILGTICYVIWRIVESIKDPYAYGHDAKGIARRIGIAMSTIPDALITLTGIQIMLGTSGIRVDGQPVQLRQTASSMLDETWGEWAVISIGVVTILTALVQFFYGVSKGYKERLDIAHFSKRMKTITHVLAGAGYFSRGVIVGIIGFFFMKAGILDSPEYIVNTDKAVDFIGDHVGHFFFILLSAGTISYGVFMFIQGSAYDPDKG